MMATKREPSSFYELQRSKSLEYFQKFGRSDFQLITYADPTLNAMGRVSAQSTTTTSNVIGDLQFDPVQMKQYIDLGIANTGDGIFYTTYDVSISANDEIVVDSVTWKLTTQVEGEQTSGNTVYQGWIAVRKPEA